MKILENKKGSKRVLLTGVDTELEGGVANYYSIIKKYFNKNIDYFTIGSRKDETNYFGLLFRIIKDYIKFIKKLKKQNYDIIQINPSLDFKSIVRDGIFIIISKIFNRKVVVMFRGWNYEFERRLEKSFLFIFKFVYFRSDAFIVLAEMFKKKLLMWGYNKKIYTETTIVDDELLDKFSIGKFKKKWEKDKNKIILLFLARIEKNKGIYETIEIYELLKKKIPFIELIIAGNGSELEGVKNYIASKKLKDIKILGYVKGKQKEKVFESSDIYIFPTYHGEGMPNSVLEAMAYGLPVVTRSVGGLIDFFKNIKMGFITQSKSLDFFVDSLEKLIFDKDMRYRISLYNYKYSRLKFRASKCMIRIENIWNNVINE